MCRLRKRQLYKYCSEVIIPPNVISANLWKVPSVQDVITCYSGPVHIKVSRPVWDLVCAVHSFDCTLKLLMCVDANWPLLHINPAVFQLLSHIF